MDEIDEEDKGIMAEGNKILETNADEKEWYLECERVANKLVINKVTDRNEWRMHLDLLRGNFTKI